MRLRAQASAFAILFYCGLSASAQTVATSVVPRLFVGVASPLFQVAPSFGLARTVIPSPVLRPLLAAPPAAPAVRPALALVRALSGELSVAAARNRDTAPQLSAAFDGGAAADRSDMDSAALTPEQFALKARNLFVDLRRSEAASALGHLPDGSIPTEDEMRGRMERLPATNPEREKFMIELFKLAGAKESDIVLQDAGRGRRNIMVVKKGRTDRVIVVGGHHDKSGAGRGTIDNGTGATLVANLYQALHGVETDATIVFVAFAREEEGLLGSREYVRSLSDEQRSRVDAMINLDTLAVDGTFSWKNNSTRALLERFAQVSRESGHALKEDYLNGGDADSSTFRDAGIPAVTIYGASQDVIFDTIHSERDNMGAFSLEHYKNAYLLTLEAIKSLDRIPLGPDGRDSI